MAIENHIRYIGDASVPQDIRRLRKNNLETMRRVGQPAVVKHMYNDQDVRNGVALKSPNFDSVYGQVRHDDPISHGVGYVSVETSTDEWVSPEGDLVTGSVNSPGTGYTRAPKYRGYGPGYLVYVIMPDVAQDFFKLSETGALIKIQTAQVQMGWNPDVNDNDLLVLCEIDREENVIALQDRYLLKMTNPVSIRGLDRKGRQERPVDAGNRHVVTQQFEVTLLPVQDVLQTVECDR